MMLWDGMCNYYGNTMFMEDVSRLPPGTAVLALGDRSVLGSWVGVRRLFHLSLFLTASRMVLTQDPSTDPNCALLGRTRGASP